MEGVENPERQDEHESRACQGLAVDPSGKPGQLRLGERQQRYEHQGPHGISHPPGRAHALEEVPSSRCCAIGRGAYPCVQRGAEDRPEQDEVDGIGPGIKGVAGARGPFDQIPRQERLRRVSGGGGRGNPRQRSGRHPKGCQLERIGRQGPQEDAWP